MGKYYLQDTPLAHIERLMMQSPNSIRDEDEAADDFKPNQDLTMNEQSRSQNGVRPSCLSNRINNRETLGYNDSYISNINFNTTEEAIP